MTETGRLTEERCYQYFRQQNTPTRVIRHCIGVSNAAYTIGKAMNETFLTSPLDLELIRTAALVHDMCRVEEDHGRVAAEILRKDGYPDAADAVEEHMFRHLSPLDEITVADLVCLGDRLVCEDQYVGVDRRIDYLIHKPGETEERTARLNEARKLMHDYVNELERRMGCTVDSLFRPSMDEILKQVEKPARYTGNEINVIRKDPESVDVRFAFAFPDLYEIGMSYMGLQILYNIINKEQNLACERVFAPASDMEELMRSYDYPLFTLENKTPVAEMDVMGFTLQYEMSFTNVLNMLELAQLPLHAADRDESMPLVIAGGPCAFNPEPLADFIDLFMIGDGEKALPDLLKALADCKKEGLSRREALLKLTAIDGVYVPAFYEPVYGEDGILTEYRVTEDVPYPVRRAIVPDLEDIDFPENNIVPLIETVHDRAVVETFRGCTRGCRFCQAGMIYRPVRERSKEKILDLAAAQIHNTGHDELSILSLSTSDYSCFEELAISLMRYCKEREVSLSLPSLRLDSFSFNVLQEIQKYKKSGLTFAPEAGTQRLRDIINKGITEEDIYGAVEQALELGWRHVKLYFMIGLPGETDEDLDGIAQIARNVMGIHKRSGKGGRFNVTVSISNFVPKAHTPFQWAPQDSTEEFRRKHDYLTERLKIKGVTYNYHDDAVSTCEAILARGDRRCGDLLLLAHRAGCKFDGWSEHFNRDTWKKVLEDWDVDYRTITERSRSYNECLPWDVLDSGISKVFLMRENEKAKSETVTHDCRYGCTGCGMNRYTTCPQGGIYV